MFLLATESAPITNQVVLAATSTIAAWTDWRTWRIPNNLIAGSMAASLMLAAFAPQAIGISKCILGGLIGLLVFMPIYVLKGMAAGDLKLMAALGMASGPWIVIDIALMTALIGGAWALIAMASKREVGLLPRLVMYWRGKVGTEVSDLFGREKILKQEKQMIPYGVVIAMGTYVALW